MNKLIPVACVTINFFSVTMTHAEPVFKARGVAKQTAEGGRAARSAAAAHGNHGALAGHRGMVADGQGNVAGAADSAFTTESGRQGARSARLKRSSDGTTTASGQSNASGPNGSADRSGSFTRNADGATSGERNTTITNANTGVTLDGATNYSKDAGLSRTASCTDSAGNTVACLGR